jgi:hypothetical protein
MLILAPGALAAFTVRALPGLMPPKSKTHKLPSLVKLMLFTVTFPDCLCNKVAVRLSSLPSKLCLRSLIFRGLNLVIALFLGIPRPPPPLFLCLCNIPRLYESIRIPDRETAPCTNLAAGFLRPRPARYSQGCGSYLRWSGQPIPPG